jgi:diguanylate cyclase (GGDEF)-like protein
MDKKGSAISLKKAQDHIACEREPIHLPGSIQPYGILFVVDQATDVILQTAGHTGPLFGSGRPILGNTVKNVLGDSLATLIHRAETVLTCESNYLGVVGPFGDGSELTVTAHLVHGSVIVELEPHAHTTLSAATMLANIRANTERIGGADDILVACKLAICEVRRITGYDRVMIYKFLADGTGSVIAETKDGRLSPFLNHRYPASDIPKQARELYQRNAIRVIPDVSYTPAPLILEFSPATKRPLDMSSSVLRSVSPVHIQYLKNMDVGASMSVSLLPRSELWGLIACHNTTAKLMPYEVREACKHVGQILSQAIRAREQTDSYRVARELDLARDGVMRALISVDDPGTLFLELCPELQIMVPSHGVAILRKGIVVTAGHAPSESQVRDLGAWLEHRISNGELFVTNCLAEECPVAKAFASEVCGLLSIVLPGDVPVTLMWFRAEQVEEIQWAGNPNEAMGPGSHLGALNPRKSFATWRESVRGRSRAWEKVELETVQGFMPRAAFVLQQERVRQLNHLLSEANDRLAALASTDSLTGVANRRAFDEFLGKEWARASRVRSSLALIILDLDFFKQYNDFYGHGLGDECLRRVAQTLQEKRRAADFAARIGGEEFALILPDTDIQGAMAVAEATRSRIERLELPHSQSPMGIVTASFGAAVVIADRDGSAQALMQAADKALYEAKRRGRNRVT